ncbi:putative immunoglobulin-blocking virulence protein [[Mycoplasma] phocae]|nr:putative immunoglobulin-blocking virulence protein [[Mycoplasma] phocae]
MKFFKKKRNKILLGVVTSAAVISIVVGTGLYFLNSDSARNQLRSISAAEINSQLINKDNLDIRNANSSVNDNNLKEINDPQKINPKKDDKIITAPDRKRPESKKENHKDIKKEEQRPGPIIEKIEENNSKRDDQDGIEETYVDFGDIKVKVKIRRPGRKIRPTERHLANREEYLNDIVGQLISVDVTDELIKKNSENIVNSFKNSIFPNDLKQFKETDPSVMASLIHINRRNPYYENLFDRYRLLFDNPNDKVKEFLTEKGKSIYDIDIKKRYIDTVNRLNAEHAKKYQELLDFGKKAPPNDSPKFDEYSKEFQKISTMLTEIKYDIEKAKYYKYSQLIANLDFTKFSSISSDINANLHKGLVIDPNERNVYVDSEGNLNSYASSPLLNHVTSRNERDNSKKRAFGIPGYFGRSSDDVSQGNYPGWHKSDVTRDPEFRFLEINGNEGIQIHKLTKDLSSKLETKRDVGYVVTIDASNKLGYAKTLDLIKKLKQNNKEITSYRIKNIGLTNNNQDFFNIFKELPENLPQLELFFEGSNTSALIALETKKIDELAVYTTGNSLADHWSINPYALKGVAWVNNLDYNVSWDYPKNAKIASRITFDSISFEESDFKQGLTRVNDGLKIAYWVRNNEPIFQGGFGPGLDPDNNEKGNSYPVGLDLTRVTSKKSLKGLQFKREEGDPDSSKRRLKGIGLYNDSSIFTIDVDDLNDGQFDILDTNPYAQPRSKIYFSNGTQTRTIKITNNKKIRLDGSGKTNLQMLLKYSPDNFNSGTKIEIDKTDSGLVSDLSGFNISESNGIEIA